MMVQFHLKAPEFVMRQWYKHVVGAETTSSYPTKDHAWNEISGRYTPVSDYYIPEVWRKQSEDNKQASEGELDDLQQKRMTHLYERYLLEVERVYETMVKSGMAKEQARVVLPLSQYTEAYWTASFQAIMNFIDLRDEKTAQWEIQQYAKSLKEMMYDIYPETVKIWSEVYWK
jgi:thymidylate synthase (FAD)